MYNLFYNLIYNQLFYGGAYIDDFMTVEYNGNVFFMSQYLSVLMATVCTVIVYVVVCLFVVKIIKVFTNLFRG